MRPWNVPCAERATGESYTVVIHAPTFEQARLLALEAGHLLGGSRPVVDERPASPVTPAQPPSQGVSMHRSDASLGEVVAAIERLRTDLYRREADDTVAYLVALFLPPYGIMIALIRMGVRKSGAGRILLVSLILPTLALVIFALCIIVGVYKFKP